MSFSMAMVTNSNMTEQLSLGHGKEDKGKRQCHVNGQLQSI